MICFFIRTEEVFLNNTAFCLVVRLTVRIYQINAKLDNEKASSFLERFLEKKYKDG